MDYIELYKQNILYYSKNIFIYKDALNNYYNNSICKDTDSLVKTRTETHIEIKCDKTNVFLKIELPKYHEINKTLNNYNIKKKELLVELNNLITRASTDDTKTNQDTLTKIKKSYKEYEDNIINISKLISYQKNKISILEKEQEDGLFKVNESYYKKAKYYSDIEVKDITRHNKNQLIQYYNLMKKNSKGNSININKKDISNLAKELKITDHDISNWLMWINECINYIRKKRTVTNMYKKLIKEKNLQEKINSNFLFKIPAEPIHSKNIILSNKYNNSSSYSIEEHNLGYISNKDIQEGDEPGVEQDDDNVEPESQDDVEPEGQDDVEPEGQDDVEPEGQDDVEPESQDDVEPEGQDDAEPEGQDDVEPESQDDVEPESQDDVEPEGQDEVEPEGQDEVEPEGHDDGDDNKEKEESSKNSISIDDILKESSPYKSKKIQKGGDIKIVRISQRDLPPSMHNDLLSNKYKNVKLQNYNQSYR